MAIMTSSAIFIAGLLLAFQDLELCKGYEWQNLTHTHNISDGVPVHHEILPHTYNLTSDVSKEQETGRTTADHVYKEFWIPDKYKLNGSPFIAGGKSLSSAYDPLVEWHVGIYSKAFDPYMQVCGGSLVTSKAVVSAAHCFWSESDGGALPAAQFAAAAGKQYRPWNESNDYNAQHSDISAVHLPMRFRGSLTNFQDDIAVALLMKEFTVSYGVRPVCIHFDEDLEAKALGSGNEGVIVGWGLTSEDGAPAQTLQYLYMPYVPVEECIATAEPSFLKYITSDKICAGVTTGHSLCRGDSGGGLVFFEQSNQEQGFLVTLPYLYGIASTAPRNEHGCNTRARAALTRALAHRGFLRTHVPDLEDTCTKYYRAVGLASRIGEDSKSEQLSQMDPPPICNCNCYCNCYNHTTP